MNTEGVVVIGKRVAQKNIADATIMAEQPPEANQRGTMTMQIITARVLGTVACNHTEVRRRATMVGHLTTATPLELMEQQHSAARQHSAMLQGHQGGT